MTSGAKKVHIFAAPKIFKKQIIYTSKWTWELEHQIQMATKNYKFDSLSKGDEQRDERLAYPTHGQGGNKSNSFLVKKFK